MKELVRLHVLVYKAENLIQLYCIDTFIVYDGFLENLSILYIDILYYVRSKIHLERVVLSF